jgi:hypothetical protein
MSRPFANAGNQCLANEKNKQDLKITEVLDMHAPIGFKLSVLSGIVLLGILLTADAWAAPHPFSLPEHAKEISENVYDLGYAMHNGRQVRGIAFLHPRDNAAKPDNPGGGRGGGGGGDTTTTTTSSCFTLIAKGARWKAIEDYMVDPANLMGMSDDFVNQQIDATVSVWNNQLSGPVFGSRLANAVDGADRDTPDGKNEVMFGVIENPGVIAVTITWGVFSGAPRFRELVEWDQVYDDRDFVWGDADSNINVMDLLNIAVHEVGHAAGLSHPDLTCTDETMYAYATEGETKKRDLNDGDIAGIQELYQ